MYGFNSLKQYTLYIKNNTDNKIRKKDVVWNVDLRKIPNWSLSRTMMLADAGKSLLFLVKLNIFQGDKRMNPTKENQQYPQTV